MVGMIVVHEAGHILAYLFINKELPDVKIKGIDVTIPLNNLTKESKIWVLVWGILAGLLFLFIIDDLHLLGIYGMTIMHSLYCIGCGHDILQLMKLWRGVE